MSASFLSSAGLDPRRKRILFRCQRRGIREMDIAMTAFAEANLTTLSDAELTELETWLDLADPDILSWITGEAPIPAAHDTPLFARLAASPREAIVKDKAAS